MSTLKSMATSSVGRKFLMALTGLSLATFVGVHLVGNFTLLMGAEAFNGYAHFLESLLHGMFIYIAEAGLIALFLLHAWTGITVYLQKLRARDKGYEVNADAGGASRKTWASRTMIITGPVLLLFVVLHVVHFKYGPGVEEGYEVVVHGAQMRDLYSLVVLEFNKPLIALGYIAVMVLLGLHLRHGIWSALQSLGATNARMLPGLAVFGLVLAVALAIGFVYIPLHILIFVDPTAPIEPVRHAVAGGLLP